MSGLVLLTVGLVIALVGIHWSQVAASTETRMALIVTLGVVAAVYNVIVPVPNVEATTTVVVAAALILGGPFAAAVGVVAIIGTSSVASVGVWTIWQIVAICAIAGVVGACGSAVRQSVQRHDGGWRTPVARALLLVLVGVVTISYDLFTTVTSLATFGGYSETRFVTMALAGIPFFLVHLVATVTLAALVATSLLEALERARPRLDGGRVIDGS